ncbi:hypothetical protein [Streptomyces sp. SBT349]|uniref:hypothetical protein n=1 Tax=Streptomyces sp. SBT349 TaxID=1580539 RepID=UPI00066A18F8|nr:hypothetical protein [Streptomyces sp. SBT349]
MTDDSSLPDLRALIHSHTGEVTVTRRTERGFSSDLTAIVECEKGPFFVKAMRNRPGGRRDSLVRERVINPFVLPLSPELLWHAEDQEWMVLGFEVVDGRRADFGPGSTDLPVVVELLNRVRRLSRPEVARDWTETRWDRFAANEAEATWLRGDALLHTDINPGNVMIGSRDAWAVDWSWPSRGAAFIDPARLVVQLIASGRSAEEAESWAAGCAAWAEADPRAVDAFAAAEVRMLWTFALRRPEATWRRAMAEAAEIWTTHRGLVVR